VEVLLQRLQREAVLLEALAQYGRDLDEGVLSGSDVEGLDHQSGRQLRGIAFEQLTPQVAVIVVRQQLVTPLALEQSTGLAA
jgi:hypothetical protein